MNKYNHIKKKAIALRKRGYSLGDICGMLAMPKATVYGWIKGIVVEKRLSDRRKKSGKNLSNAQKRYYRKISDIARNKREDVYNDAKIKAAKMLQDRSFRDFVVLYIAEGFKKSRWQVAVTNSDPAVINVANYWIRKLSRNKLSYSFQFHDDLDEKELKKFWASIVGVLPKGIWALRKSNSGKMYGRKHRLLYGVFQVRTNDTFLRSQMQAYMDYLTEGWKKKK